MESDMVLFISGSDKGLTIREIFKVRFRNSIYEKKISLISEYSVSIKRDLKIGV